MSLLTFIGLLSTLPFLLDLSHIHIFLFCLCLSGIGQGHLCGYWIGTIHWSPGPHQWVQWKTMCIYGVYISIGFLLFLIVCACGCKCPRRWKEADAWIRVIGSCELTWVLGTELRSSARTKSALNCWAISSSLGLMTHACHPRPLGARGRRIRSSMSSSAAYSLMWNSVSNCFPPALPFLSFLNSTLLSYFGNIQFCAMA